MQIKKKVFLRTVSGVDMLIPVGETVRDYNGIFTLSPTAATAFRAIENGCNEEEIINKVLDEFDIDRKTAEEDVAEFLDMLRRYGII
ncbi:MAG: PqqD family protein [Ruminococcus sp.]|nr:PqqD family protein [Candidatus Copronaster equi]